MDYEIKGFRLGDILQPNAKEMTPRNIRLVRKIQESLPKAFLWSDPERRIFVSMRPGEGKDPIPEILSGEYLNVVEMIPVKNPSYTLLHEVDSDRTLIFDGNNHWKWKAREGWVMARKRVSEPTPVQIEASYEETVLV